MALPSLSFRGIALLSVLFLSTAAIAQAPPVMHATPDYLFVMRGPWIYQFDVHTLELRNRVLLPAGEAEPIPPRPPVPAVVDDEQMDEEVLEVEIAEIGGGAGGRYGGRQAARRPGEAGEAIQLGLEWLIRHQDDDGRWDCDGFMKHDVNDACDGAGNAVHDVGMTGLALLTLLGDGNTLRSGPYKRNVQLAAQWLREQQSDNGRFGTAASHDFIYDHAIAAYAMCEAYGLSDYKLLKQNAQRGLDYLESHRNPYAVWRYQPRDNDNDTSVTSWCLMALKSGEFFGLDVNRQAFELGLSWLDQVTGPDGRVGYTKRGENSSRMPGNHSVRFPVGQCETLTAAGLFCRFFLGQKPSGEPIMKASADVLLSSLPRWDQDAGTIDHYYWYYGTYAMYQLGGDYWKKWQKQMSAAVLAHQERDGSEAGSWDPVGVWGDSGGRIYSTSLMVLTLQAYYRYTRLVR